MGKHGNAYRGLIYGIVYILINDGANIDVDIYGPVVGRAGRRLVLDANGRYDIRLRSGMNERQSNYFL